MRPQLRTPGRVGRGQAVKQSRSVGPYPGAKYLGKKKQVNNQGSETADALNNRLNSVAKNNGTQQPNFEKQVKSMQGAAKDNIGRKINRKGGLRNAVRSLVQKKLAELEK